MTVQFLDAVVIGGGFFGCEIAAYLKQHRGFREVMLIEQGEVLLGRASLHNQARVHGGYHYPRDFVTAHRSRVSRPRFLSQYPSAIFQSVTSIYAIARSRSQVNASNFERRMERAGAKLREPEERIRNLFSPLLVEEVFEVDEEVFDALELRRHAEKTLDKLGVKVLLENRVTSIRGDSGELNLSIQSRGTTEHHLTASYVFNRTYSGLNTVNDSATVAPWEIKHEIADLAVIQVPGEIDGLGITVMDGPFFSLLPYPPRQAYSLSHVRYTPQVAWIDDGVTNPYDLLTKSSTDSRHSLMLRDASRYLPKLAESRIIGSFREVKTVLAENEENDGRPILVEKSRDVDGLYSILGGKIDNVFDVLDFLSSETFERVTT